MNHTLILKYFYFSWRRFSKIFFFFLYVGRMLWASFFWASRPGHGTEFKGIKVPHPASIKTQKDPRPTRQNFCAKAQIFPRYGWQKTERLLSKMMYRLQSLPTE